MHALRVTRVAVCVKALIIALPSAPGSQPPDSLALAVPAKAAAHVDYPHLVRWSAYRQTQNYTGTAHFQGDCSGLTR